MLKLIGLEELQLELFPEFQTSSFGRLDRFKVLSACPAGEVVSLFRQTFGLASRHGEAHGP